MAADCAGRGGSAGEKKGPRSWAEDLNTYRSSRGSQSLSTIQDAGGPPPRFCRTNYVPFLDTRHPLFPYNDFQDGKGTTRVDQKVYQERCARHGWGDTSLLKEEGYQGLSPQQQAGSKVRPASPRGPDGRNGLFGVLQMTEQGGKDSWIGHPQIDPSKGKRPVAAPPDSKGRRDLFDVLHARAPGMPADDSWLGNKMIDPAKGKASAPGPEQLRGRRDLTDIVSQTLLHDPNRLNLLAKGADKLGDAWCGHMLIDPARGKAPTSGPGAVDHLHGAVVRPPPPGHPAAAADPAAGELPRRHTKQVPAPVPDSAKHVLRGEGPADDYGRHGKKPFPEMPQPNKFDGRRDLYAHMTYKPLTDTEQAKWSQAFDDRGARGRRTVEAPGAEDPAKSDMLQWRPNVRLGQFVPHGGLAQENRIRGSTVSYTI